MLLRGMGVIVLVAGLPFLPACAGPLQQWGAETSQTAKAPSFDPSALQREGVAVLNAVVGMGLEGYRSSVSRSLSDVLSQTPQPIRMIPTQDALSLINRQELAHQYASIVSEYVRSGILDRKALEEIGRALGVRYVFQPSMASFSQSMAGRFSFFGVRLLQTRISMLRLSVQLWDTQTGEMVWEGSGEATLANEDIREARIPFDEIARRLWLKILQDLWTP